MIAANVESGRFIYKSRLASLYRVHDVPVPRRIGWAVGSALACAALAGAILLRRRARGAGGEASTRAASPRAGLAAAERELRRACRVSDPEAASAAVRALALARWPDWSPFSAQAWVERLKSPALGDAIRTLDRVRYAPDCGAWEGTELWDAYRGARRDAARGAGGDAAPLPALYPAR